MEEVKIIGVFTWKREETEVGLNKKLLESVQKRR